MGDAVPSEVAGRGRGADAVARVNPRLRGVSHEVAAFVFRALGFLLVLLASATSRVPVAIYIAGGLDRSTARVLLAAVWGLAAGGIVIRNVWLGTP